GACRRRLLAACELHGLSLLQGWGRPDYYRFAAGEAGCDLELVAEVLAERDGYLADVVVGYGPDEGRGLLATERGAGDEDAGAAVVGGERLAEGDARAHVGPEEVVGFFDLDL